MLVDPLTVVAQIINFLLLVVALKLVLYDRVIAAMDRREQRIAARIADADRAQRDAAAAAERHHADRAALAARRETLLAEARDDAERQRREMVAQAREEVDGMRDRWQRSLADEQDRVIRTLRRRAGEQVCEISRRTLRDLADAALERQAIAVAVRRLRHGDELAALLAERDGPVEVRTAFPLDDAQAAQIDGLLRERDGNRRWRAATDPSVICGLELRVGGAALGWTVAAELDALATEIAEVLPGAGIADP